MGYIRSQCWYQLGVIEILRGLLECASEYRRYSNWALWLVVKVLSGLFEGVFIGVVAAPITVFIAFGWTPLDMAVLLQMVFIECDIDGFWSHIVGTSGNCGPKAVEAMWDGFLGWKGVAGMFGKSP